MTTQTETALAYLQREGEAYFKIPNVDALRPFLMTLISSSDHWMFVSSNGGLTAGRKNAERALFPYYTDDKLTRGAEGTGSKSIFRVARGGAEAVWEPFSVRQAGTYQVSRNLYKSEYGDKVTFEEINHDLELTFEYRWSTSDAYGFVRQATLRNDGSTPVQVDWVDGIQNVLPYGVDSTLQTRASNLVDAYKRSELHAETGLGIFALSALIIDRAEPGEALRANVVWSAGLPNATYLLSARQLDAFRQGREVEPEADVKGEKGAYFVRAQAELAPGATQSWHLVANLNQDHGDVAELIRALRTDGALLDRVAQDVAEGTAQLLRLNAAADGLMQTDDPYRDARHFSNVMFNIMRGGIFDDGYQIDARDFLKYLRKANGAVYDRHAAALKNATDLDLFALRELSEEQSDPDFRRLAYEYLPLKFSRRHGDPSRPWNRFSINTRDEADGSKMLDYEGNWRDIFQNWEALSLAFPEFLDGMIFKFLNASTFEGYNPYRITKDGFDWEVVDPEDPWAYIGYWGDHQIIYLLKLLELLEAHRPGQLQRYFEEETFVYAAVPYVIKPFADILRDAKDTIEFDAAWDERIRARRKQMGADGALLQTAAGEIYRVNFVEKILTTVLAKVSNLIPGAGIWMNTQRPEWNDANNALVGNGVSMVTLCYLYRFLKFFAGVLQPAAGQSVPVSEELLTLFRAVAAAARDFDPARIDGRTQRDFIGRVGEAASAFRHGVYEQGFSGHKADLPLADVQAFIAAVQPILSRTIELNQRADKLFHAYNLVAVGERAVEVSYLNEMLEGQVAALSSGRVNGQEAVTLLDHMKESKLFRPDQYSYLLYPNKDLPGFLEKNRILAERAEASALIRQLVADGNEQIVSRDVDGVYHFNGSFSSASYLKEALEKLSDTPYADLARAEADQLLDLYEEVFDHKSFTGRSGTFFGYEGLGSIYWHMVSKLLLAVQEVSVAAVRDGESPRVIGRLMDHYYEIQAGIGVHKSPKLYGAFPVDAYSHTPGGKGAQQPGMTGQVKEDILCRFGELGVFVREGRAHFNPCLLRREELSDTPATFEYIDVAAARQRLELPPQALGFTYCQAPVVYHLSGEQALEVRHADGTTERAEGHVLTAAQSDQLFRRTGAIAQITVHLTLDQLR